MIMNNRIKTYFQIADANLGVYYTDTFKTEDEARKVIETEYKNRCKNDGYDEYWKNKKQVVIKVTHEVLDDVTEDHQSIRELDKNEQAFINSLAEDATFKDWCDESCGNFVGWSKEFDDFTLSVHRENTAVGGLYHYAKMKKGYRASFDYQSNLISEKKSLSLFQIQLYIRN